MSDAALHAGRLVLEFWPALPAPVVGDSSHAQIASGRTVACKHFQQET